MPLLYLCIILLVRILVLSDNPVLARVGFVRGVGIAIGYGRRFSSGSRAVAGGGVDDEDEDASRIEDGGAYVDGAACLERASSYSRRYVRLDRSLAADTYEPR